MKIFYSPAHLEHAPGQEFEGGRMTPAVEVPRRVEGVKAEVERRKLGPILAPRDFGMAPIAKVHDAGLVTFLSEAAALWHKRYGDDAPPAIPSAWPSRGMKGRFEGDVESRLGSYAFDTATPILRGTWAAALAAVNGSLSAAEAVKNGERAAFALARPPGHHASNDVFGGYCYLNNVAIAAQWLRDQGMRPAILDVDYHHGNGTQSIFYGRDDVLFVSIHGDPSFAYPHFLGFADETGERRGEGANLNLPLPMYSGWDAYSRALDTAVKKIEAFGPDVLLVSLGLDTFEGDPISRFKLTAEDYLRMGARLAKLKLPTLFQFEGGYNLDALPVITANVLEGFTAA
ncbi:MAG: histone deacetylase family protein [Alphaproteobacteria bacterium]|nr:histone deacetylase family protein [Alphaproteobacteria bacterium]MBV9420077.1 histone deacetylase family protein [Alphaproteobacteria bacterium]